MKCTENETLDAVQLTEKFVLTWLRTSGKTRPPIFEDGASAAEETSWISINGSWQEDPLRLLNSQISLDWPDGTVQRVRLSDWIIRRKTEDGYTFKSATAAEFSLYYTIVNKAAENG